MNVIIISHGADTKKLKAELGILAIALKKCDGVDDDF